jgi:hypothetical protein
VGRTTGRTGLFTIHGAAVGLDHLNVELLYGVVEEQHLVHVLHLPLNTCQIEEQREHVQRITRAELRLLTLRDSLMM